MNLNAPGGSIIVKAVGICVGFQGLLWLPLAAAMPNRVDQST